MHKSHLPIILIFILIAFSFSAAGQDLNSKDSMIRYSDLHFLSDFESTVFSGLASGQKVSLMDMYLAIDVSSESEAKRFRHQFEAMIRRFQQEGIEDKKDKKKVKGLYEQTHATLMKKYEEEALFPDIFRTGTFNCVTGSITYSLVFEAFDIPHYIQKGTNHVYLVAYPESHTIVIESTDSEEGYIRLGQTEKSRYVDQLSQGKLITEEERIQGNISDLFLQYAYSENQVDEKGLAAMQYSNKGLLALKEQKQREALYYFEKAGFLSPQKELEAMIIMAGGLVLHMSDYSNMDDVKLVCKLARYSSYGITDDDIMGEFERITQKVFYDRDDMEKYREAYEIMCLGIENEDLVHRISRYYYGEIISDLLHNNKTGESLEYLAKLYALEPDDRQIQNLIQEVLLHTVWNLEPIERIEYMEKNRKAFPGVFEMHGTRLADMSVTLVAAEYMFDRGDPVNGNTYITTFEEKASSTEDLRIISKNVVTAYQTAAYYYYNKNNLRKAREFLNRGLKVMPGNRELLYMKNSI